MASTTSFSFGTNESSESSSSSLMAKRTCRTTDQPSRSECAKLSWGRDGLSQKPWHKSGALAPNNNTLTPKNTKKQTNPWSLVILSFGAIPPDQHIFQTSPEDDPSGLMACLQMRNVLDMSCCGDVGRARLSHCSMQWQACKRLGLRHAPTEEQGRQIKAQPRSSDCQAGAKQLILILCSTSSRECLCSLEKTRSKVKPFVGNLLSGSFEGKP